MKKLTELLPDLLVWSGAVCVTAGLSLVSTAAAFVVGGIFLIAAGVACAMGGGT